jgi:hypothetical protein
MVRLIRRNEVRADDLYGADNQGGGYVCMPRATLPPVSPF